MKLRTVLIVLAVALVGLFVGRSVTLSSAPAAAEEPPLHNKSNVIVDEVRFDATPLGKVIDTLCDKTHANIVVRWDTIYRSVGVAPEFPVTLRLENVSLSTVLHHLLADIPAGLGFSERDDGVIVISAQDDLPQEVVLRFYDISDLIRRTRHEDAAAYRSSAHRLITLRPRRSSPAPWLIRTTRPQKASLLTQSSG